MNNIKKYLSLLALSIAGGCMYQIPYIKYILYNTQMDAMGITNHQSSILLVSYTIGTMILYIPGGIVTDRFSPKKLLVLSLGATSLVTFLHAFTNNIYILSVIIWAFLSMTTTFVFWSALMKGIRMIGSAEEQGRMYGLYYAGNGISLAIANSIAIWASSLSKNPVTSYKYAVLVCGFITAISCISIIFLIKEDKQSDISTSEENKFKLKYLLDVIKNPIVWIFALIMFCSFSLFSNLSYLTPYLVDVIGMSDERSGFISVIRQNLTLLMAPVGGLLAEKVFRSTSKLFIILYSILTIAIVVFLLIPKNLNPMLLGLYTIVIGALFMMAYGIQFSIISECKIPTLLTGTVVGIVSVIGYSPDFFLAPRFGALLDKHGTEAYSSIFITLSIISAIAAILSFIIRKLSLKNNS